VAGTLNLAQALAQAEEKPRVFVCGSAIGYYGDRGDEVLSEESAPGTGFLAEVCQEWEEATTPAVQADIRTAHLRTGIVLSPKGGRSEPCCCRSSWGLGGRTGDGRQWMSWIDVQDMVGAIHPHFEERPAAGAGEHGRAETGEKRGVRGRWPACCRVRQFFPCQRSVVKLSSGRWAKNCCSAARRWNREADLERVSVSVSGVEGFAGGIVGQLNNRTAWPRIADHTDSQTGLLGLPAGCRTKIRCESVTFEMRPARDDKRDEPALIRRA
jgi:nucleoside-diphosphate-sugar epimerase